MSLNQTLNNPARHPATWPRTLTKNMKSFTNQTRQLSQLSATLLLLAISAFCLPAAAQAGDPAAGKAKAFACTGCHGLGGTKVAYPDVYKVPKLGGQHAAYIVAALKSYKAGERFNETMKAQATLLSEKDMADIAAYYAADKK